MGTLTAPENRLRAAAVPLDGGRADHDALLERIGEARFVLLGQPTHGSREPFRERARITKRLIEEKGFDAVALEADWPDAHRLHRWVQGTSEDADAEEALRGFARFPAWMWRNTEMIDFAVWLRLHNDARESGSRRVGIYGIDLYSLYTSIDAILTYLERVEPDAATRARAGYGRLGHFGRRASGAAGAGLDLRPLHEEEAVRQLMEIRQHAIDRARRDRRTPAEELFHIEQNALLVKSAEAYYRTMLRDPTATWNIRDRHMADSLAAIAQHLDHSLGRPSKICVWAHNAHVGDARATEMGPCGYLNVGRLARERYARDAYLVGFTTYEGQVTAASDWNAPALRHRLLPAAPGSHEALLHRTALPAFTVVADAGGEPIDVLRRVRTERAIGVIYRPETERESHCLRARIGDQFDALVHVDRTRAIEPLEGGARWIASADGAEAPETFPFAL